MSQKKTNKLKLSRETLRGLSPRALDQAAGAAINVPTATCVCTIIPRSVLDSCFKSDCCLYSDYIC